MSRLVLPPSASAERYLVLFNVDQKTLEGEKGGRAELDGEATVSLETARRVTCDSAVVRIVRGAKSEILDGCRIPDQAPPMALPASAAPDPVRAMVQEHRFRGIEPANTTGSCRKVISPEKMDRFWEGLDPSE